MRTWATADDILSGRNFPPREPFDFVADLAALDPQDIFDGIKGLSEARYERDLYRVFSETVPSGNKGLVAMHKAWFEVSCGTDGINCYAHNTQRLLALNYAIFDNLPPLRTLEYLCRKQLTHIFYSAGTLQQTSYGLHDIKHKSSSPRRPRLS